MFSLKSIIDIRFVQLELLDTSLAQIRKVNDLPPEELCRRTAPACRDNDCYTYNPAPAETMPPIGKDLFMHLLEHPEVAKSCASLLFERVPRRLHQQLTVRPEKGYSIGWGLQYVEGISMTRVFVCGLLRSVVSTLVGIAYAVRLHDTQGGFAIGAYMLMTLMFVLGSAQALLDR